MLNSYINESDDDQPILEYGRASAAIFFGASIFGFNALRGLQYEKYKKYEVDFMLDAEKEMNKLFADNAKTHFRANPRDHAHNKQEPTPAIFLDDQRDVIRKIEDKFDNFGMDEDGIIRDIVDQANLETELLDVQLQQRRTFFGGKFDYDKVHDKYQARKIKLEEQIADHLTNLTDKEYLKKYGITKADLGVDNLINSSDFIDDMSQKITSYNDLLKQNPLSIKNEGTSIKNAAFSTRREPGQIALFRRMTAEDLIQKKAKMGYFNSDELKVLAMRGMLREDTYKEISAHIPQYEKMVKEQAKYIAELQENISKFDNKGNVNLIRTSSGLVDSSNVKSKFPMLVESSPNGNIYSFDGTYYRQANTLNNQGKARTVSEDIAEFMRRSKRDGKVSGWFSPESFENMDLFPISGPTSEVTIPFSKDSKILVGFASFDNAAMHASEMNAKRQVTGINTAVKESLFGDSIEKLMGNVKGYVSYAQSDQALSQRKVKTTSVGDIFALEAQMNSLIEQRNVQTDIGLTIQTNQIRHDNKPFVSKKTMFATETLNKMYDEAGVTEFERERIRRYTENSFLDLDSLTIFTGEPIADGQGSFVKGSGFDPTKVMVQGRETDGILKIASATTKATVSGSKTAAEFLESGIDLGGFDPIHLVTHESVGKAAQGLPAKGKSLYDALIRMKSNKEREYALDILFKGDKQKVSEVMSTMSNIKRVANYPKKEQFIIKSLPGKTVRDSAKELVQNLENLGRLSIEPLIEGVHNVNSKTGLSQFDKSASDMLKRTPLGKLYYLDDSGNITGVVTKGIRTDIVSDAKMFFRKQEEMSIDQYTAQRSGAFGRWMSNQSSKRELNLSNSFFIPEVVNSQIILGMREKKIVKSNSIESKFRFWSPMYIDGAYNVKDMNNLASKYGDDITELFSYAQIVIGSKDVPANETYLGMFHKKRVEIWEKMKRENPEFLDKRTSFRLYTTPSNTAAVQKNPEVVISELFDAVTITPTDTGYIFNDEYLEQLNVLNDLVTLGAVTHRGTKANVTNTKQYNNFQNTFNKLSKRLYGKKGVLSQVGSATGLQTMAVDVDKFLDKYIDNITFLGSLNEQQRLEVRRRLIEYYDTHNTGTNTIVVAGNKKEYFKQGNVFATRSPAITESVISAMDVFEIKDEVVADILYDVTGARCSTVAKTVSEYEKWLSNFKNEVILFESYKKEFKKYAGNIKQIKDYKSILSYENNKIVIVNKAYSKIKNSSHFSRSEKDLIKRITERGISSAEKEQLTKELIESMEKDLQKIGPNTTGIVKDIASHKTSKGKKFSDRDAMSLLNEIDPEFLQNALDVEDKYIDQKQKITDGRKVISDTKANRKNMLKLIAMIRPDAVGISINSLNKLDFDGDLFKLFSVPDVLDELKQIRKILSSKDLNSTGITVSTDPIMQRLDSLETAITSKMFDSLETQEHVAKIKEDLLSIHDELSGKTNLTKKQQIVSKRLEGIIKKSNIINLDEVGFLKEAKLSVEVAEQWSRMSEASKLFFKSDDKFVSITQAIRMKGDIIETKKGGIGYEELVIGVDISEEVVANHLGLSVDELKKLEIKKINKITNIKYGGAEYAVDKKTVDEVRKSMFPQKIEVEEFVSTDPFALNKYNSEVNTVISKNKEQLEKIWVARLEEIDKTDTQLRDLIEYKTRLMENNPTNTEQIKLIDRQIEVRQKMLLEEQYANKKKDSYIAKLNEQEDEIVKRNTDQIDAINKKYKESGHIKTIELDRSEFYSRISDYEKDIYDFHRKNQNLNTQSRAYKEAIESIDRQHNFSFMQQQAKKYNLARVMSAMTMKESLPAYFKYQAQFNMFMDSINKLHGLEDGLQRDFGELLAKTTQEALNSKKVESGGFLLNFSKGSVELLDKMIRATTDKDTEKYLRQIVSGDHYMKIDDIELAFKMKLTDTTDSKTLKLFQNDVDSFVKTYLKPIAEENGGNISFSQIQAAYEKNYNVASHKETNHIMYKFYEETRKQMEENSLDHIIEDRLVAGVDPSKTKEMKNIIAKRRERYIKSIVDAKRGSIEKYNGFIGDFYNYYNALNSENVDNLTTADIARGHQFAQIMDGVSITPSDTYAKALKRQANTNAFLLSVLSKQDDDLLGGKLYLNRDHKSTRVMGSALPLIGLGALAAYAIFGPRPRDTINGKIRNNMDFVRSMRKEENKDPVDIQYQIYQQTSTNPIVI